MMERDDYEDATTSDEEEDDDDHERTGASTPEKRARHAITGRGVTLSMLLADGIIKPGESALSLEYLGQKFTADLLPSGKIKSNETGKVFLSPSSWAIFCKKLVNPSKKSGCGWASVKYKGFKLDTWKMRWLRQKRPHSPYVAQSSSPASAVSETTAEETDGRSSTPRGNDDSHSDMKQESESVIDLSKKSHSTNTPIINGKSTGTETCFEEEQEEALNLSLKDPMPVKKELKHEGNNNTTKERTPIKFSSLAERGKNTDVNTLVECERFNNMSKTQPYTVSVATNAMMLMDFHSHLTTSEIVGYLGGKWDTSTQHLSVVQAFPCRCRLGDTQRAPMVEEEIRQTMKRLGLSLVGWYHSHPYCKPEPSIKDIECQMNYQLRMKGSGSTYFPCVGIIVSPYNRQFGKCESSSQMYMVMPSIEESNTDYGTPMHLRYSLKQNTSVSEDLLSEMKNLTDFYGGSPDWIKFRHSWQPSVTFIDKLKKSLANKLPEDQMENGTFLDFVQHLLIPK